MCNRDRPEAESSGSAAFFDVDGTLVSTHIVHQYAHVRKVLSQGSPKALLHPLWLAAFYVKCLYYLYLDSVSRTRMNIAFYRNYRGLAGERVRQTAEDCFRDVLQPNLFAEAAACIEDHFKSGRRVVLVTGSIDFLIRPLAEHLSEAGGKRRQVELLARTLKESQGVLTGALDGPPIGGQEKADVVERFAVTENIDLASSYAYGDSIADLPMLQIVGHPVTVNADRELAKQAAAQGWDSCEWNVSSDGR